MASSQQLHGSALDSAAVAVPRPGHSRRPGALRTGELWRATCYLVCLVGVTGCEPEPAAETRQPAGQATPMKAGPTPPARLSEPAGQSQPQAAAPSSDYPVPLRSDGELRQVLRESCEIARRRRRPLLVEAGAAWCQDCRALLGMEEAEPLAPELEQWTTVHVNLGEDRHEWLRSAFGIKAIARWIAFLPERCEAPVETWSVRASRVVEPATSQGAGPASLLNWLKKARGELISPTAPGADRQPL